ncbi:hypothetical protein BaRGS_00015006, partial [Batillaria attramentaria]
LVRWSPTFTTLLRGSLMIFGRKTLRLFRGKALCSAAQNALQRDEVIVLGSTETIQRVQSVDRKRTGVETVPEQRAGDRPPGTALVERRLRAAIWLLL